MDSDREVNSGVRNHVLDSELQRQGQEQATGAPSHSRHDQHRVAHTPRTEHSALQTLHPEHPTSPGFHLQGDRSLNLPCPASRPPGGLAHWFTSSAALSLKSPHPRSLLCYCSLSSAPHSAARPPQPDPVLPPLENPPWLSAGLGKEPSSLTWDSRPFRTRPLLTFTPAASRPRSAQSSPLSIHPLPDTPPNCPGLLPGP